MNDLLVYVGLVVTFLGLVSVIKPPALLRIRERRLGALLGGLGLALALLGGTRSDDGTRPGANPMGLDDFLPLYHFREVHAIRVRSSPERIFRAIQEVTPRELGIAPAVLVWIRSLPARIKGRSESGSESSAERPMFQPPRDSTWFVLLNDPHREFVVGLVGRFWEPYGQSAVPLATVEEFRSYDRADYVKVALNLYIEPLEGGECRLSTETRIYAIDAGARRKFGVYWAIIYPGAAIIRRGLLKAIKRRAEQDLPLSE